MRFNNELIVSKETSKVTKYVIMINSTMLEVKETKEKLEPGEKGNTKDM